MRMEGNEPLPTARDSASGGEGFQITFGKNVEGNLRRKGIDHVEMFALDIHSLLLLQ